MPQFSEEYRKLLEKQQYAVIGNHSAVKVCGWTKNMLRGRGGCYKLKFYGIMSHQCIQMTPSLSCANRCTFCWRDWKAPVAREWKWEVDNPEYLAEESVKAHVKLLTGFGGNEKTPRELWLQSRQPRHVALSLTGEPITYPKINELIDEYHRRKISTFLVTNAQYPEQIRRLRIVTQLYISMDAPTKDKLKEIDRPLFPDYWNRFLESLKAMSEKRFRKTIRITAIKGMNMEDEDRYAELIGLANPEFVEVKAYMYVGASREMLEIENMPRHHEVAEFARAIAEHLPDYEIVSEHKPSRVVLLARKEFRGRTWIDFEKFFRLVSTRRPEEISAMDYTRGVGEDMSEKEIEETELD